MYGIFNELSGYTFTIYFYISKNLPHTLLLLEGIMLPSVFEKHKYVRIVPNPF